MNSAAAQSTCKTAYSESSAAEPAYSLSSRAMDAALLSRLADYAELTKPRISIMVLLTVIVGYTMGCEGNWQLSVLLSTLLGVSLVASGSSALNQYLERFSDAAMPRTAGRPLPRGTLSPWEVAAFGIACGLSGTVWLALTVNMLTALLTLATLLLYVAVYTPLKRRTSLCTAVGAVPGALPPVLGWAAAQGTLDAGAFSLFAVLFLWQFPHFLAIAWLYREQYERAGLKMLPRHRSPRIVGLLAVTYAVVLIPASLLPHAATLTGDLYAAAAVLLGIIYLAGAVLFAVRESRSAARGLLFVSLIYLPCLFLVMTFDRLRLLM
ncbi:MAG: heme o synthase [Planctomycetaceae bacterium]|nr:heme o synthase [Planctomycetaceae bacterium]